MSKSIFVTATDTEVGKTFISALLIKELLKRNINAAYIKPFETGLGDSFKSIDYNFVKKINPELKITEDKSVIDKYYYPLAPYDSAIKEKRSPDVKSVLSKAYGLIDKYEFCVVEGAGGVYVPITKEYNILDFIKELKIPCLVVCRANLGTINHSVLTLKALEHNGVHVKGFVLNGECESDNLMRNAENIERMSGSPCIGFINKTNDINTETHKLDYSLIFRD